LDSSKDDTEALIPLEEDIIQVDTANSDYTSDSAESDPPADADDDFIDASADPVLLEPAAVLQPAIVKGQKTIKLPNAIPKRSPRLQEQVNKALLCVALTASSLDIIDPNSYKEAMKQDDKDKWHKATVVELKSIISNDTFKLVVLPSGRNAIKTRLVYRTNHLMKTNCSKWIKL
jgi:hypothetical protein